MKKMSEILFIGLLLMALQSQSLACNGTAIGSIGRSSAPPSGPPPEPGLGLLALTFIKNAVIVALTEYVGSLPPFVPFSATFAPTFLDPENAAAMDKTVDGLKRQRSGDGSGQVDQDKALRDLDAQEKKEYGPKP